MHQINYKITVQYEGTRYKGWQKQPGTKNTIQGKHLPPRKRPPSDR